MKKKLLEQINSTIKKMIYNLKEIYYTLVSLKRNCNFYILVAY